MNRIILDTETAGNVNEKRTLRVYDLGFIVVDENNNPLTSRNWVIADVFYGMTHEMQSAYYADKLPAYRDEIQAGIREVITFVDAKREFAAICKEYGIKEVWAYNANFDRTALNVTLRTLSNGFCSHFIPYGVKWCCIHHAAVERLCNTRKYYRWCLSNGFVSKAGNVSTSAETVYAYLLDNPSYKEEHTAYQDALIENEILHSVLKKKKKLHKEPIYNAWIKPQKGFKEFMEKEGEC